MLAHEGSCLTLKCVMVTGVNHGLSPRWQPIFCNTSANLGMQVNYQEKNEKNAKDGNDSEYSGQSNAESADEDEEAEAEADKPAPKVTLSMNRGSCNRFVGCASHNRSSQTSKSSVGTASYAWFTSARWASHDCYWPSQPTAHWECLYRHAAMSDNCQLSFCSLHQSRLYLAKVSSQPDMAASGNQQPALSLTALSWSVV